MFHIVANETSAYAIWKKLEEVKVKNSATNKALLMRRLVNLKLKEGGSIGEHLNDFQEIVNQLAAVNFKVDDETQALMMMSSLPESWETLVVALNNSNSDGVVSMESVVISLLNEEMRRINSSEGKAAEEKETTNPLAEVHFAKRERRSFKPNTDRDFICYYCEKPGHQLKFCNKLRDDKERMKTQEGSKNKLEVDRDEEVNFGISNDVLCVDMSREGQ